MARRNERIIHEGRVRELALDGGVQRKNRVKRARGPFQLLCTRMQGMLHYALLRMREEVCRRPTQVHKVRQYLLSTAGAAGPVPRAAITIRQGTALSARPYRRGLHTTDCYTAAFELPVREVK